SGPASGRWRGPAAGDRFGGTSTGSRDPGVRDRCVTLAINLSIGIDGARAGIDAWANSSAAQARQPHRAEVIEAVIDAADDVPHFAHRLIGADLTLPQAQIAHGGPQPQLALSDVLPRPLIQGHHLIAEVLPRRVLVRRRVGAHLTDGVEPV